jgi:dGTPase
VKKLSERIRQADSLLATYAVPHGGRLGRETEEKEDETRFPFQRDRDRIIHTQAFRRLQGKTQVFITGGGDHYRTRLTHTMEVAQLSRDISRALSLNEDLAECIALAHDLGHPPFGHTGEEALDTWMRERGSSFEHNEQSYRIVTLLETHSALYQGLNLHREILEGLQKHSTPHDHPAAAEGVLTTLEAQVTNIADEIAYTGHDCDDGLSAGILSLEKLRTTSLVQKAEERLQERGTSLRGALIDLMVSDLYETSCKAIEAKHLKNVEDVTQANSPLTLFSTSMRESLDELRAFLWENLYLSSRIVQANSEAKNVVTNLLNSLEKNPTSKVLELQKKTGSSLPEAIKDYVSGMTDNYAIRG